MERLSADICDSLIHAHCITRAVSGLGRTRPLCRLSSPSSLLLHPSILPSVSWQKMSHASRCKAITLPSSHSHSLNISPPCTSPHSFRSLFLSHLHVFASPSVPLHRLCFVLRLSKGALLSHPPHPTLPHSLLLCVKVKLIWLSCFHLSLLSPLPVCTFPTVHPAVPNLPCLLTVTV